MVYFHVDLIEIFLILISLCL